MSFLIILLPLIRSPQIANTQKQRLVSFERTQCSVQ